MRVKSQPNLGGRVRARSDPTLDLASTISHFCIAYLLSNFAETFPFDSVRTRRTDTCKQSRVALARMTCALNRTLCMHVIDNY